MMKISIKIKQEKEVIQSIYIKNKKKKKKKKLKKKL